MSKNKETVYRVYTVDGKRTDLVLPYIPKGYHIDYNVKPRLYIEKEDYKGKVLPEVVITNKPVELYNPRLTDSNISHREKVRLADLHVNNIMEQAPLLFSGLSFLNFISPANVFGTVAHQINPEYYGKGHNWTEDLVLGNSGMFTDKWASEHPYFATLGNLGTDAAVGYSLIKGLSSLNRSKKVPSIVTKNSEVESLPKEFTEKITSDNAKNISDAAWDHQYNKAIQENNIAEVQRLRDLHFKTKSNTKLLDENSNPLKLFHNSDAKFNEFSESKIGVNDPGFYGKGIYSSPDEAYASTYGENKYSLYGKSEKLFDTANDVDRSKASFNFNRPEHERYYLEPEFENEINNADGVYQRGVSAFRDDKPVKEVVLPKSEQYKLADAITRDDAGNIIPLSKRDNFNIKDLRYGTIPFLFSLFGINE